MAPGTLPLICGVEVETLSAILVDGGVLLPVAEEILLFRQRAETLVHRGTVRLDELEEGLLFHPGRLELVQMLMDHQVRLNSCQGSAVVQRGVGIFWDGVVLHWDELVVAGIGIIF